MAIYNADDKYIFLHIFRTGGTSIRTSFDGEYVLGGHILARDLKRHFEGKDMQQEWEEATKFTVVRNPFDWMVSVRQYIQEQRGHPFHRLVKGMSMAEFLLWYEQKNQEPRVYGTNIYATLSEFIDDDDGTQLMDVVLKFEHYPGCIHGIRDLLGLPPIEFPKLNTTNRSADFRDYYDDESRALVERIFARDLERFGYSFE